MDRSPLYLGFLVLVLFLALAASGSSAAAPEPPPASGEVMKAIVYYEYGSPDVLRLEDVNKPVPKDDQVLVKVKAAAANPLDWHTIRGSPYLMRMDAGFRAPKEPRLGVDMAGVVEAVGKDITKFKVGDEVFGTGRGAFGEYIRTREIRIALKPASVSFEEAAAIPVAALTALQGLRDTGKVKAGQTVLINGASGGVGTYAVQLAKVMGAEVTAVCSGRNIELVRSLGADYAIDYTQEDFTENGKQYDVLLDLVGTRDLLDLRRAIKPDGIGVLIGGGGPDRGNWIGALSGPIKAFFLRPFVSQEIKFMLAEINSEDLAYIAGLMTAGKVKSVIDRRYALAETADAIRYLETGRARGKVIINVE